MSQSTDKRPIRLRVRPDLILQPSVYQGENSWIVKDPVAMKYFRLQRPEKVALQMVDGSTSFSEIQSALESAFPEKKIRLADIHMLVNSFHKNGLLISDSPGQTAPLQVQRNKELRQKGMQLFMSALSLKFPGVDPERFLSWLYPKLKWLFSRTATAIFLLFSISALVLVLQNIDEFYRRLPEFQQFFNLKNFLLMGSILIVTKSIHELGHGLMCKHFGGECHEIGFMLLVMTPAMYCNTSDSWILPNKWHRIAIGAAGMYVEVVLASFCTFVWWYTQPGTVHYIALNAMFLCGVSTLIFNANPLLRYDGYYMLSDYLEIPNMGSKSRMALLSKLRVWCLGMKPISPRLLPTRRQFSFAIYAVASFVYRWFVMLMIFWFLTKMFEPYGLEILGHALIVISLVGMIGIPFYKLVKFFIYPGRFREVKFFRFAISLVLFTIAVGGLFAIPVTHNVAAPFVVQPTEMQKVFVTTPGRLVKVNFSPGDKVKENDIVAELENDELVFELEQIKNQIKSENAKLDAYEIQIQQDIDVSGERESAQTAIENLTKKLAFQQEKIKKLQLVANRSGIIIPPPNVVPQKMDIHDTRSLQKWSGTPLDPENRQAYLETQTLYCKIGDSKKMKAMLMIDQSSAKFVQAGQKVVMMLDEFPGKKLYGQIEFVSREPANQVPRELSVTNGGTIASQPNAQNQEVPMIPAYEASVTIDTDQALMTGFRGHAKIRVGSAPLGKRLIRYLNTVINFR